MTEAVRFGKLLVRQRLPSTDPALECYLAEQEGLERTVELRLLAPGTAPGSPEHARFLFEARTFTGLDHHNVLKTIDAGVEAERLYYVVNFRKASSFETILTESSRAFTSSQVLDLGLALSSALIHIHASGLLHLDIGPASVSFAWDDEFPFFNTFRHGVGASVLPALPPHVPVDAIVRSTPEARLGLALDARTDTYLLCAFLYRVLTLATPFAERYFQRGDDGEPRLVPVPPATLSTAVPKQLNRLLVQGLARDPAERFESAEALREALDTAQRRMAIQDEVSKSAIMSASSIRIDPELLAEIRKKKEEKKQAQKRRAIVEEAAQARTASATGAFFDTVRETFAAHPVLGAVPILFLGLCGAMAWMFGGGTPPPGPTGGGRVVTVQAVTRAESLAGTGATTATTTVASSATGGLRGGGSAVAARVAGGDPKKLAEFSTRSSAVSKTWSDIRRVSTSKETFEKRWQTMQSWLLIVPPKERDEKGLSYVGFIKLKIDFASDPDAASRALDQAYEKAAQYLEHP